MYTQVIRGIFYLFPFTNTFIQGHTITMLLQEVRCYSMLPLVLRLWSLLDPFLDLRKAAYTFEEGIGVFVHTL